MGLCFGKACSTDGRSATIQRKARDPQQPGTSRITTPGQTFQELLARKAEEAFEPGPSSSGYSGCREKLPSIATEVWGASGFRNRGKQKAVLRNVMVHPRPRRAEEFPVFGTGDESSGDMTIVESPEYNSPRSRSDAESFSSFRNGSMGTLSIYEDVDVAAVAGSTTPVYSGFKPRESNSSSREIVDETGSDSSVTNDFFPRESFTSLSEDRPKEKVIMVDSRSGSQDVLSLEFLEEFCRISEITSSHASSCSEADPKEVLVQSSEPGVTREIHGAMSSCTRHTRYEERHAGEYKPVEASFVDFLCSQSQAQLSSSPGSSNKKRQSTSEADTMSESMTKKPRFSPEQETDTEEINGFMKALVISSSCSPSEGNSTGSLRRISFTVNENESSNSNAAASPSLKILHLDDCSSQQTSGHRAHRYRHLSTDKTPPSTPGSFRSTPFASVGSSFSMEEMNFRRSLSPRTPLSAASFTSAGALSLEEMTAIWSAFQDGQYVQ